MGNNDQRVDHILSRRATLAPEAIPTELFPLFLYYKRDRVGHESPSGGPEPPDPAVRQQTRPHADHAV